MPTLVEIAHELGNTAEHELTHLGALVSEWGMLADFCFADMLLYLPTNDQQWIVAAQVRAATGQTLYETDLVGLTADSAKKVMIAQAHTTQKVVIGEINIVSQIDPVSLMAIPVRCDDRVVAVLTREWSTRSGRKPGQLERMYLAIFDVFAKMISTGLFPFEGRVADATVAPLESIQMRLGRVWLNLVWLKLQHEMLMSGSSRLSKNLSRQPKLHC